MSKLGTLRDQIASSIDIDELRNLCLDVAIDYDELVGGNKSTKIGSLIIRLQSRSHLGILLDTLQGLRPNLQWPAIADIESDIAQGISDNLLDGRKKRFLEAQAKVPELMAEMRKDLSEVGNEYIREFFLADKSWIMNNRDECFAYYFNDFKNLPGQLHVLENYKFVIDISPNSIKWYRMSEEFVDFLLNRETN